MIRTYLKIVDSALRQDVELSRSESLHAIIVNEHRKKASAA